MNCTFDQYNDYHADLTGQLRFNSGQVTDFLFYSVHIGSGAHPVFCPVDTRWLFLEGGEDGA
jgi:hypothetical protein